MRESPAGEYTQVLPPDPGDVVDNDDGSYSGTRVEIDDAVQSLASWRMPPHSKNSDGSGA